MTTMQDRFISAATSKKPANRAQLDAATVMQKATVALAELIDEHVPNGRDKAIALTSLEDALMRANRGLFAEPEPPSPLAGIDFDRVRQMLDDLGPVVEKTDEA